jgi:hypothetical protein
MSKNIPLLVVLDLDETLIHTSRKPILGLPVDYKNDEGYGYIRPGTTDFLGWLFNNKHIRVMIWTSANKPYALSIMKALNISLDQLELLFTDDRLVTAPIPRDSMYYGEFESKNIKDLRKVRKKTGHPFSRMIAIDDKHTFFERQYSNLILIPPYTGDVSEINTFPLIKDYLEFLLDKDNVRPYEKRGFFYTWREENNDRLNKTLGLK